MKLETKVCLNDKGYQITIIQIANTQIYAFLNSPTILQLLSCCAADITIVVMLQILNWTVQCSVQCIYPWTKGQGHKRRPADESSCAAHVTLLVM